MAGTRTDRQRLRELVSGLVDVSDGDDRDISGLTLDSRHVQAGDLFIALRGTSLDGRDFVHDAEQQGATAVLCEAGDGHAFAGLSIPVFVIKDLRTRVGIIADRFFGSPSKRVVVVGITGTNGKTTCSHLLAQALDTPPRRCALIGTLGSGFPTALKPMATTTPDAIAVHRLLAGFVRAGATHVSMEVSSHALEQARITGIAFDIAVFTNLSRDHLDYHGDMVGYGAAKSRLFAIDRLQHAVINRDDPFGRELLERLRGELHTISFGISEGDVHAREIHLRADGLELHAATPQGEIKLRVPLLGRFNVANLLAVLACLLACGLSVEAARKDLRRVQPVAGRVEPFGGEAGVPLVVVDYAHTPDALEQVLRALRAHTRGRLYCVFGCGGDRDRGKRPQMGQIAERLADVVVLSDDNPRHEPGDQIIDDIADGMHTTPRVIRDRASAIRTVIREAAPSDVVLIAGKGHEEYQLVGDKRVAYSDRDTVRNIVGEAA